MKKKLILGLTAFAVFFTTLFSLALSQQIVDF